MRKLSLLFAAALMAFAVQTAWAEDNDIDIDDEIAELSEDAGSFVGRWRSRGDRPDGPRHMMGRHGGPGRGPAMPPRPPCMGPNCDPMMPPPGMGMRGMGMGHRFGHRGGMRQGMFGPRFMEELELTDAQKTQLVDVLTDNFKNRLLTRMELHDAIAKLRTLNEAETPDYDAIVAANAAVGTAQGKMDVLDRKLKEQVRGVLTPEQTKKLDERKEKIDQAREGRGGKDRDRKDRRDDRPGHKDPRMQRGPGPRMMD